jgi:hypothetical protein
LKYGSEESCNLVWFGGDGGTGGGIVCVPGSVKGPYVFSRGLFMMSLKSSEKSTLADLALVMQSGLLAELQFGIEFY